MSDWRESRAAAAIVIGLFLLIQFAVPLSRLGSGDPARFGWQMYSSANTTPDFTVETADGEVEVDLRDYLVSRRVEIDLVSLIPEHLCSVVDGAIRVTWEGGEHTC